STQRVALTQITIANSITSLRDIARMEWKTFVERESVLEVALRADPVGTYAHMTFATRDWYRHVVERIAKRTGRDEAVVARLAVELARTGAISAPSDPRRGHVGYYLVDDGLPELERITAY